MPRLSALRVGAIAALADELRFAPRARVLEIVRQTERYAPGVDPDDVIELRGLVRALTGYAPDDADAAAPGDAVRADLSAFAEHLTERLALVEAETPPDSLRAAELARRWGVSVKTIARDRRRGLVGRRVRSAGRVALVFTPEAVRAFEKAHPEATRHAGLERLTPEEKRSLAETASRLTRRFGWPRTRCARALAARHGRAYETVRRALRAELGPPVPAAPSRRALLTAWNHGQRPADLARRFGTTPATIRRWVARARAAAILAYPLPAADPPMSAPRVAAALASPAATHNLTPAPARTAGAFVDLSRSAGPADPAADALMADAHTALLLSARRTATLVPHEIDDAETALRWASLLRTTLASRHRRLALGAIESAIGGPLLSLSPPTVRALHRVAMSALVAGVAHHDARRGGSVAGAMNVALTRALARAPETPAARRALAGTPRAQSPGAPLDDWTTAAAPWDQHLAPPPRPHPAGLAEWIARRHGLDGVRPATRAQACEALGITRQRGARLDLARRAATSIAG